MLQPAGLTHMAWCIGTAQMQAAAAGQAMTVVGATREAPMAEAAAAAAAAAVPKGLASDVGRCGSKRPAPSFLAAHAAGLPHADRGLSTCVANG